MGEMREWWTNQYDFGAGPIGRNYHLTRDAADAASRNGAGEVSERLRFRIHVRLKPEGAPKRYANADER